MKNTINANINLMLRGNAHGVVDYIVEIQLCGSVCIIHLIHSGTYVHKLTIDLVGADARLHIAPRGFRGDESYILSVVYKYLNQEKY